MPIIFQWVVKKKKKKETKTKQNPLKLIYILLPKVFFYYYTSYILYTDLQIVDFFILKILFHEYILKMFRVSSTSFFFFSTSLFII